MLNRNQLIQIRKQYLNTNDSSLVPILKEADKNLIFTYGTLKQSHQNHQLLENSKCLGQGYMKNKTMLDIGSYPAIIEGNGIVKGEIYEIDKCLIPAIDDYEGEGILYKRKIGIAYLLDLPYFVSYYEWLKDDNYPIIDNGVWFNQSKSNYVWYATYGSNLLEERFMKYIHRTNSQQIWLDTKILELPYNMYYANESSKWNGGVSFLDITTKGKAISKAYLITKDQLKEIHQMEGNSHHWYNIMFNLQDLDGFKVYTLTNSKRLKTNHPSNDYLEVIAYGMMQFLNPSKISNYLHYDIDQLDLSDDHINNILQNK